MPDPNQDYNGPYTEAHLQDGTILKFKGDLDPISVKQKVATFKAGTSPTATSPELPKPEFSAGSSEGWMDDPANKAKLDQSIAGDTATMAPGGVMASEGAPATVGRAALKVAKDPRVQGAAGGLAYHYAPSWAKSMLLGAGLMSGRGGGGAASEAEGEAAATRTVGEPPVVQAPEPREPMAGEQPGAQYSVPREQLPANVRSGQPGAGEAYRSIGGKVIYTPPTTGEEPIDMAAMRRAGGVSATGKPRMLPKSRYGAE
jgi:hypothetical protein